MKVYATMTGQISGRKYVWVHIPGDTSRETWIRLKELKDRLVDHRVVSFNSHEEALSKILNGREDIVHIVTMDMCDLERLQIEELLEEETDKT